MDLQYRLEDDLLPSCDVLMGRSDTIHSKQGEEARRQIGSAGIDHELQPKGRRLQLRPKFSVWRCRIGSLHDTGRREAHPEDESESGDGLHHRLRSPRPHPEQAPAPRRRLRLHLPLHRPPLTKSLQKTREEASGGC